MKLISIILTCFITVKCYPQKTEGRFSLEPGISVRTTIFYYEGLRGQTSGPLINYTAPYSYKSGVNGTGITLAYGYTVLKESGIRLIGATTFRYDFYKFEEPDNYEKVFYVDQSFFVTKSIFSKAYVGAGFTLFNLGKELKYDYVDKEKTLELQFNSFDILFGFPFGKSTSNQRFQSFRKIFLAM